MKGTCVGFDIGTDQLKIAVCTNGDANRLIVEPMPDNLVKEGRIVSPETLVSFLKQICKKHGLRSKKCALVLPASVAYTRSMTLPVMTEAQLKINLPFEFRDFVKQDKDKYYYDYAVLDTLTDGQGKAKELELIGAAASKDTINLYKEIFHRSGLNLAYAVPSELCYMYLMREHEKREGTTHAHDYCIIDLGHTETRLHIFKGQRHQVTRVVEYGAQMVDTVLADKLGEDIHIARLHKNSGDDALLRNEDCLAVYSSISVEIMRAIVFYRFNTPGSNLTKIYICGGAAKIAPFVEAIAENIDIPLVGIEALLPKTAAQTENAAMCHAAIGAALQ